MNPVEDKFTPSAMTRIDNDDDPEKEKVVLYYGFLIHSYSDSEVHNLLGLFSTLGTILTFTTGILLATFSTVNQAEIDSIADGIGYSYNLWVSISFGMFFGATGVILSLILYTSLAAANIPESKDYMIIVWLRSFKVFILLMYIFFICSMICITYSLYNFFFL